MYTDTPSRLRAVLRPRAQRSPGAVRLTGVEVRIHRIDFDHPAKAVVFVGVLGYVRSLVELCTSGSWRHSLSTEGPSASVRRRVNRVFEMAIEVLFAGQIQSTCGVTRGYWLLIVPSTAAPEASSSRVRSMRGRRAG